LNNLHRIKIVTTVPNKDWLLSGLSGQGRSLFCSARLIKGNECSSFFLPLPFRLSYFFIGIIFFCLIKIFAAQISHKKLSCHPKTKNAVCPDYNESAKNEFL